MASYLVILFLIGIDGAGVSFDRNVSKASILNKFLPMMERTNADNPSIFKIICDKFSNYKVAAFASWEKIITGMIKSEIVMRHIYGSNSYEYYDKLALTDNYVSSIVDDIINHIENPLIIQYHGGLGKGHDGGSDEEKNVFIGWNHDLKEKSVNINSNMC
ncbi:19056_t:CDS:2 [Rhizophagus irregularis]|uniref:Uncharacterized protein n=1 Tax=Rhizophagus irregularis (strain DAOM 181602 / DAOM 197198 / MUCL 43194) TaxID=747089 RepID=U9UL03_RHIID|nr:19056_t:CDS:2 [Rhizophagus irregularis]